MVETGNQHDETFLLICMCCRVWLPQAEALLNIQYMLLILTPSHAYLFHASSRVLFNAEFEKKNKYTVQCVHLTSLFFLMIAQRDPRPIVFEEDCMQIECLVGQKLC